MASSRSAGGDVAAAAVGDHVDPREPRRGGEHPQRLLEMEDGELARLPVAEVAEDPGIARGPRIEQRYARPPGPVPEIGQRGLRLLEGRGHAVDVDRHLPPLGAREGGGERVAERRGLGIPRGLRLGQRAHPPAHHVEGQGRGRKAYRLGRLDRSEADRARPAVAAAASHQGRPVQPLAELHLRPAERHLGRAAGTVAPARRRPVAARAIGHEPDLGAHGARRRRHIGGGVALGIGVDVGHVGQSRAAAGSEHERQRDREPEPSRHSMRSSAEIADRLSRRAVRGQKGGGVSRSFERVRLSRGDIRLTM